MNSKLSLTLCIVLLVTGSYAFTGKSISSYTKFYSKESGATKASNDSISADWKSCDPKLASCVTKLPSDATQNTLKAECHTNSGAKNVYDFAGNADFFNLLKNGDDASSLDNWVDELCGKPVASSDFVIIYIYLSADESEDWAAQTASLYQSSMRVWYLFDGPEPISPTLLISNDSAQVEFGWEFTVPPQGSGLEIVPFYLPTPGNNARQTAWTNLDRTDYCRTPSTITTADSNVGTTVDLKITLPYETYLTDVTEVEEGNLEISDFDIQLIVYNCDADTVRGDEQKIYISGAVITYDKEVSAAAQYGVTARTSLIDQLEGTLRLDSDLVFCEDAACENEIDTRLPTFFVSSNAYVKLSIPQSTRTFKTTEASFVGVRDADLDGVAVVTVEDDSQGGQVIFRIDFLEAHDFGVLQIVAVANGTETQGGQRLLAGDDPAKKQSTVKKIVFKTSTDDTDSAMTIFASVAAFLFAMF